MDLLTNLGVNTTFWAHLVIFLFTYFILTELLFKPYLKNYLKQLELTEGNEEQAEKLNLQISELVTKYENIAKGINLTIKNFYDTANNEARVQQNKTLELAKKDAEAMIQKNRQTIAVEIEQARKELKQSIPEISKDVEIKFLGSDA